MRLSGIVSGSAENHRWDPNADMPSTFNCGSIVPKADAN
jgi:hypothetical protein